MTGPMFNYPPDRVADDDVEPEDDIEDTDEEEEDEDEG